MARDPARPIWSPSREGLRAYGVELPDTHSFRTEAMVRLLFIPEAVAAYDLTGRVVVWSWLIGAAIAWLCSSLAAWLLGFWEGGGLALAIVADFPTCALASAIVPAILTWRWTSA
jgi:hypothetical protein